MMNARTNRFCRAWCFAVILSSCSMDEKIPLEVLPASLELTPGQSYQLTATVSHAHYLSDDSWYATVLDDGFVTGRKPGRTTISVQCGNQNTSVDILVSPLCDFIPEMDRYVGNPYSLIADTLSEPDELVEDNLLCYWFKSRGRYSVTYGLFFDKDDDLGLIRAVYVLVPPCYGSLLLGYLDERYSYVSTLDDARYYYNRRGQVKLRAEYLAYVGAYSVLYY